MIDKTITYGRGYIDQVVLPWRNDTAIKIAIQILILTGMAGMAAYGKSIHPSWGVPGSSAPYWLAPLIMGRCLVKRDGAGLFMGAGMALWGVPIGLNHTLGYNVALYSITGLVIDIASKLPRIEIRSFIGAIICGLLAHMVKFGFILWFALSSSIVTHFMVMGTARSALLHAGFGVVSGIAAWIVFKGGRHLTSAKRH